MEHSIPLRLPRIRGWIAENSPIHEWIQSWNGDIESALENGQVLKQDARGAVYRKEMEGTPVLIKEYRIQGLIPMARVLCGTHRGKTNYLAAQRLRTKSISTPRPYAAMMVFHSRFSARVFYFSEYIQSAISVAALALQRTDFATWIQEVQFVEGLGILISRLHQNGFAHGDLKLTNILVETSTGRFWLIDLDGFRTNQRVLSRSQLKDLSRLMVAFHESGLSELDGQRFLAIYCEARGMGLDGVYSKMQPFIQSISQRHLNKQSS